MHQHSYGDWAEATKQALGAKLHMKVVAENRQGPWPPQAVDAALVTGGRIVIDRRRDPFYDMDPLTRPLRGRSPDGQQWVGPTPVHGSYSHAALGLLPARSGRRHAETSWVHYSPQHVFDSSRWLVHEGVTGHLLRMIAVGIELDESARFAVVSPGLSVLWHLEQGDDGHLGSLAPTETKVTELAASGFSHREIAELLSITVGSVETFLARAAAKVRDGDGTVRTLMRIAHQSGLVDYRCTTEKCVGHPERSDPLPRCPSVGVLAVTLAPIPK